MTPSIPAAPGSPGLCWKCNYPLHSAFDRKCPECGRAFDPADPRTMNMGPAIGRLTRRVVAATGWPTIALAGLLTAAILYVTGFPLLVLRPGFDELVHLFNVARWKEWFDAPTTLSTTEWVTLSCAILWGLLLLVCGFRWLVRGVVRLRHGRCFELYKARRRRLLYVPILFLITAALLLLGWPNRMADAWAHRQIRGWFIATSLTGETTYSFDPAGGTGAPPTLRFGPALAADYSTPAPLELPEHELREMARHGTAHLRSSRHRIAAMGILTARWSEQGAADDLLALIQSDSDPATLTIAIRLLSLYERVADAEAIAKFLDDSRAMVRIAAADGIALLRWPHDRPSIDSFLSASTPVMTTDPPIAIDGIPARVRPNFTSMVVTPQPPTAQELPAAIRPRLVQMMLTAATPAEREAAARALVHWPPDKYELRVAEWGVWLAEGVDLKLAQSVIDEIPAFVHRTNNPASEFDQRLLQPRIGIITKPILHLYASEPMSLDVQVLIRYGRPWFAYPKPDDFQLGISGTTWKSRGGSYAPAPTQKRLTDFDGAVKGKLADAAEGFPWISPSHRLYPVNNRGYIDEIRHLGLRWQSAIVAKEKPAWAALPEVGDDKRFAWWTRLREVPSDYVTSRGETERFLYYDGPTHLQTPVKVWIEADLFTAHHPVAIDDELVFGGPISTLLHTPPTRETERKALLIRVSGEEARGQRLIVPVRDTRSYFISNPRLSPNETRAALKAMLIEAELTDAEAEGLNESWAAHLFHAPGSRLILRLTREDYDKLCPIEITPTPTKMVRVGLVLYEIGKE